MGAPGPSPPMHIEWASYATAASLSEVTAWYRAHRGDATEPAEAGGDVALEAKAGKKLSVHDSSSSYPTCENKPAPNEHTVIIVSQATGNY